MSIEPGRGPTTLSCRAGLPVQLVRNIALNTFLKERLADWRNCYLTIKKGSAARGGKDCNFMN